MLLRYLTGTYNGFIKYLQDTGRDSSEHYDLEGWYNDRMTYEHDKTLYENWIDQEVQTPGQAHFNDTYKKPSHITYAGPNHDAWQQDENGVWYYAVPETSQYSLEDYLNYWKNAEPESYFIYQGKRYPSTGPVRFKEGGSVRKYSQEIQVGNIKLKVAIAKTAQEQKIGLSSETSLPEGCGMLFVYDSPQEGLWYTMENTDFDLEIIFLNEEGEVTSINPVKAHDPNPVVDKARNAQFVLEVNPGSGIRIGDELEDFEDEDDLDDSDYTEDEKTQISKSKMLVLNSEGDVQMRLEGGERIVSMIKTRQLIKAALKAYKTDNDVDYKRVGKLILKELDAQDSRDPEYVSK